MLHVPEYQRRWDEKLAWYREQEILPIEEGTGRVGTLVTTRDDERGGIDSGEIAATVARHFG